MSIKQVAAWLKEAKRAVVLTGAGMSTESGLPDFRSKAGWWRSIDPATVATVEAMTQQYELFHAFYSARLEALAQYAPHEGHVILADWETRGIVQHVATQNVDDFHQAAGSQRVYALHGHLTAIRCQHCQQPATVAAFLAKETCRICQSRLRPGVVLFGESLPQQAWQQALQAIQAADIVLVIGTSLQVYPVNQLPKMTKGKLVYMNRDIEHVPIAFDCLLQGSAKQLLQQLNIELEKE